MKNINYSEQFHKNGFVIIKDFFKINEIEAFEKSLMKTYSGFFKIKLNKKNIHKIISKLEYEGMYDLLYGALKKFIKTEPFKKASIRLTKYSQKLFNRKYKHANSGMAIGIKKSKRTAYKWHQEKPYYKSFSTIHYQFPILNSNNLKNGTMSVLSGSHNLGFIKKVDNYKLSKKSINSFVPKNIVNIKKKYPEKFINMNLKDILLFDENIIHRSNKNTSDKVRFAGIIRLREIK
tara:strand:- start:718 stop:1419 length:702 start_codon:yes stop_codon:yes gene_type:complete